MIYIILLDNIVVATNWDGDVSRVLLDRGGKLIAGGGKVIWVRIPMRYLLMLSIFNNDYGTRFAVA